MAKRTKLAVGEDAPNIQVVNADGETINLSSIWADKPVVLTFLRHFGWPFCQEMLDQLAQNTEWFLEHGVRVAAVTMGKPYEAKMFCAQRNPDIVCLSNPDQSAYKAFRIDRMGVKEMLDPGLALNGARIALKGSYKIGTPADMDALQLGATFIIDNNGVLRLVHYNRNQYDHPEMAKLKSVVEGLGVIQQHE